MQPLEKVQEDNIVQNKVEPKEEKRLKKLLYLEDPKRIQVPGREREREREREGKATEINIAEIPEKC